MESSFEKAFDKQVNPDGSIDLTFKTTRISVHSANAFSLIMLLILFPVSCAVTSPVMFMLYDKQASRDGFQGGAILMWNLAAFLLCFFVARWYKEGKTTLTIKPHEGIIFEGKQLPFTDIQEVGTMHETILNNPIGTSYVYAKSHGNQIKVTKYVPLSLAEAIVSEINKAR